MIALGAFSLPNESNSLRCLLQNPVSHAVSTVSLKLVGNFTSKKQNIFVDRGSTWNWEKYRKSLTALLKTHLLLRTNPNSYILVFCKAKIPYGEISARLKFLTAKIPFGENSVGRKLRTAKFPYSEKTVRRKLRTAKHPTAKNLTAKITSVKIYIYIYICIYIYIYICYLLKNKPT